MHKNNLQLLVFTKIPAPFNLFESLDVLLASFDDIREQLKYILISIILYYHFVYISGKFYKNLTSNLVNKFRAQLEYNWFGSETKNRRNTNLKTALD